MSVCLRHSWCRKAAARDFYHTRAADALIWLIVALMSMVTVTILIELISGRWL